jgi:hypothetical protein
MSHSSRPCTYFEIEESDLGHGSIGEATIEYHSRPVAQNRCGEP